jgi:hypothetical protein
MTVSSFVIRIDTNVDDICIKIIAFFFPFHDESLNRYRIRVVRHLNEKVTYLHIFGIFPEYFAHIWKSKINIIDTFLFIMSLINHS